MHTHEFFKCTRIDVKLTRDACGRRHKRANRRGFPGKTLHNDAFVSCAKCDIGAAHKRGEKPDVMVVDVVRRGA